MTIVASAVRWIAKKDTQTIDESEESEDFSEVTVTYLRLAQLQVIFSLLLLTVPMLTPLKRTYKHGYFTV
jgi:hypothetical protein